MKIVTLENGNIGLDLGLTMEQLDNLRVKCTEAGFSPIEVHFPSLKLLGLNTRFSGNEKPYIFAMPEGKNEKKT